MQDMEKGSAKYGVTVFSDLTGRLVAQMKFFYISYPRIGIGADFKPIRATQLKFKKIKNVALY